MRRFVIGDIHGANKALIQCLERSEFNYEEDLLISLGDVCDGWPETKQCFDELNKIKNLKMVLGNHDFWALKWAENGETPSIWLTQGGANTVKSYNGYGMSNSHLELLSNAPNYYLMENKLFVHAGIAPEVSLDDHSQDVLLWDRSLFQTAIKKAINGDQQENITIYDEVYIGHSPIHGYGFLEPVKSCGVWLMDTGAGWDGVLSMMDIDSKKVFNSDRVNTLYPKGSGRASF